MLPIPDLIIWPPARDEELAWPCSQTLAPWQHDAGPEVWDWLPELIDTELLWLRGMKYE